MFINFKDIPNHQNLFLDYLYDFREVRKFYSKDFKDNAVYLDTFSELKKGDIELRICVADIIQKQYANVSQSDKTKVNLELLRDENTFAVVTGQQLGILGGPLYTFYKIITAVKLAQSLTEKYSGYNFVPVFWLEGDDHDFDEVKYTNIIDSNNDISKLIYNDGATEEVNRGSVGSLIFNENFEKVFSDLNAALRDNDFKQTLMETYRSFYRPGKSFKDAFRELIVYFFDSYGLLIFDPSDEAVKKLLKPIFAKEIKDFRTHTNDVVKVSAELEESYHAQVKVRPINLFYSENDGRYLLEPVEEEFRLKGKRRRFTKENLLELIEREPHRFSANVLLRPICQDYLLPTAVYVGGPGEISYFAQVIPLYKHFNVVQPVVYPRASITIAEPSVLKIIDKYDFNYTDFFVDKDELLTKIIRSSSDIDLEIEFAKVNDEISRSVEWLSEKLFVLDKTLSDVSNSTRDKILANLEQLKSKASEAQKKKYETSVRQLSKVHNLLYPGENLQERELNYIYFAHKYGMNFIERIFEEAVINKYEHQVLMIT